MRINRGNSTLPTRLAPGHLPSRGGFGAVQTCSINYNLSRSLITAKQKEILAFFLFSEYNKLIHYTIYKR